MHQTTLLHVSVGCRPATSNDQRCRLRRTCRAAAFAKARPHRIDPLTTRERQIVRVMAEGLTNKEIAQWLRLAEGTVKVHLHRIYQKLGIANRTALAMLAHTNFAKHV